MIEINYQGLYDTIADTLPDDWERIILHCLSWSESCEIKYYVKSHDGIIKDCYELGIPDDVMLNKIVNLISLINNNEIQWKALTLIIDSDGSFDAKADYTSNIDDTSNYLKTWGEQYLK
ncbi:immunity protein YezG family protein [Butyrivibrio sp. AE2032]|uniref:immunity protein YezG family protein n=1 Tax=Butyrivibrio sp. AE2032 TaxID=1458463 RepID=UPI000557398E|nr:immunity protein YezG family protein [Butyrivibrio sp. AE2032]